MINLVEDNDRGKVSIKHVGYEVELDSQQISEGKIMHGLGLDYNEFRRIPNHKLLIKMSREYYSSTIEFNFMKEECTTYLHDKVKRFIVSVMKKYSLKEWGRSPSFVGTHIHFFNSGLINKNTDDILKITLQFIIDNVHDLHVNSLYRIINSHQLWGNYISSHKEISTALYSVLNKSFQFEYQSSSRPKYNPVILSPRSRVGKMRSLEIRLIPTEFILNGKIKDFIRILEDFVVPSESVLGLYIILLNHYKELGQSQYPISETVDLLDEEMV